VSVVVVIVAMAASVLAGVGLTLGVQHLLWLRRGQAAKRVLTAASAKPTQYEIGMAHLYEQQRLDGML